MDIVIDHLCLDEPACMTSLTKKVLQSDHTNIKIEELAPRKFDEKYRVLMSNTD